MNVYGLVVLPFQQILCFQELANRVIAEHQKTVEFQSTDRVIKHSSFVDLCTTVVGVDNVSVVEMWLLKENRIVKATTTAQGEQEIVKFCTKGDTITETDVGILRYISPLATLDKILLLIQVFSTCHLASRNQ